METAFVLGFMTIALLGVTQLALSLWYLDILQDVASETARCTAIGSTLCAATSCADSTTPAVCYAEQMAKSRGYSKLTASNVSVSKTASCGTGGTGFTQVSITQTYTLLTASHSVVLKAWFPNNS